MTFGGRIGASLTTVLPADDYRPVDRDSGGHNIIPLGGHIPRLQGGLRLGELITLLYICPGTSIPVSAAPNTVGRYSEFKEFKLG